MFRKPVKEVSPSTRLVQQLYSFGLDEGASADSTTPLTSSTSVASTSTLAPPITTTTTTTSTLSLAPPVSSSSSSNKKQKEKTSSSSSLRKLLKSTQHKVKVDDEEEERVLTSWKMADYAYKRDPCPFPTRARGLFTEKLQRRRPRREQQGDEEAEEDQDQDQDEDDDEYRIVARGYDKFFNVNEVSWTQWEKIPEYSTGPYELTIKSNGCIILIAAITPLHLIVTSKHSIGSNYNSNSNSQDSAATATVTQTVSHSERGEYWLLKHLQSVGKTRQELAKELWDSNLTAVAELCDDSFEEHVLPYPKEETGLHLHGLNLNLPSLSTLPSNKVSQFAKRFGFIQTKYFIFPSVIAVKTYCETVEQQGGVESSNGKFTPVEGFVVRGKKKGGSSGEAFFWKVKYDQPYLMYREWRELTRKCLLAYNNNNEGGLKSIDPKKVKNLDTRLYLWWVKREIERDVGQFDSWKFGRGIIKTRQDFLEWEKTIEGRNARRELGQVVELDQREKETRNFDKTIIVPIAIQGCGKTALGLELTRLFNNNNNWGHVQSDDFLVKKPAPHFLRKIKDLLLQHDYSVVYADKNNHQVKHRQDLVQLVNSVANRYRARLIALVYPIDSKSLPRDKFHSLMSSRIVQRGDNHQSLRAGELHESIIWQFLGQYEEFDPVGNSTTDGMFDQVIEIKPEWNQFESLKFVVDRLSQIQGLGIPTSENLGDQVLEEAVEWAKSYKVELKKETLQDSTTAIKKRQPPKLIKPRYYGLLVDVDLRQLIQEQDLSEGGKSLWNDLVKASRVELKPHVTLVHHVELESRDETFRNKKQVLWDKYEKMVNLATVTTNGNGEQQESTERVGNQIKVRLTLGPRLVWNDRVMSIEVSSLEQPSSSSSSSSSSEKDETINLVEDRSAHITVGTRSSDIRPIEGKILMEKALKDDDDEKIQEIRIREIKVEARLAGLT